MQMIDRILGSKGTCHKKFWHNFEDSSLNWSGADLYDFCTILTVAEPTSGRGVGEMFGDITKSPNLTQIPTLKHNPNPKP